MNSLRSPQYLKNKNLYFRRIDLVLSEISDLIAGGVENPTPSRDHLISKEIGIVHCSNAMRHRCIVADQTATQLTYGNHRSNQS
jgi:hypothetical protein